MAGTSYGAMMDASKTLTSKCNPAAGLEGVAGPVATESDPRRRSGSETVAAAFVKAHQVWKNLAQHSLSSTIGIGLVSGFLTLLMGSLGAITVENSFPEKWEMIWKQWDSIHYLAIAGHGYVSEIPILYIFPPVYPFLIKTVSALVGSPVLSGLLVSNLAFVVGLCLLHQLIRLDFDEKTAELTVWLLVCFPTAYFFHVVYSESVFFALSVGCIYLARKERWLLAGFLGMLAALTRTPGFVLGIVLAAEFLQQCRERRMLLPFKPVVVAVLGPFVGFALFVAFNGILTGDPLHFLKMYEFYMGRHLALPWEGLWNSLRGSFESFPSNSLYLWGLNLGYFVLASVAVVFCMLRLRFSYAVLALLTWILVFCLNFWMSVPRHLMVCFPFLLISALWIKERPLLRKSVIFSGMFLYALGLIQFSRGWWAN